MLEPLSAFRCYPLPCCRFSLTFCLLKHYLQKRKQRENALRKPRKAVKPDRGYFPNSLHKRKRLRYKCIKKTYPYPNLQLHPLVISVNGLHLKVNSHRANKGRCERIIGIPEKKGGLPHAAVPNDQKFKHVVKVLVWDISMSISRICGWGHLQHTKSEITGWGTMNSTQKATTTENASCNERWGLKGGLNKVTEACQDIPHVGCRSPHRSERNALHGPATSIQKHWNTFYYSTISKAYWSEYCQFW